MKNKTKIILSSILSIILCASLIAGATFALFTNQSEVNIAVTSGKVNVHASIGDLNTYSALVRPTDFSDYESGEDDIVETGMQLGEFAADYYHDKQEKGKFSVGGTAGIEDNVLKLSKMVPGDKATATITLTNNSNVGIKYRLIIKCTSGLKLFSGLLFKVQIGEDAITNAMSYASAWQTWELSAAKTQTLNVSVELPLDAGNEYQDLATNILFAIEAVQGNAATSDVEEIVYVPANAVVTETAQKTVVAHTDTEIKTPNTPAGAAEKETTVTFQADTSTLPAGKTSELTVETYAVAVSSVMFEVTDESRDAYAGLELILKVNGEQVTNFGEKDVTIVTYIEPWLTNVVVKYNGEGADPTDVDYNDETGRLSFKTNHFSEYYVIADTVAKIGDMPYISLASAIAAAEQGDEIVLVKNIAVSAPVEIAKQITLNLNGKTISEADSFELESVGAGLIAVKRGGDVTLTGNGKVTSTKAYSAVVMTRKGEANNGALAKLTVESGELKGKHYGIVGNGNRHDTSVTIKGGTITSSVGMGIYHPQNGTLVISGGTIEGTVGIYVKSGTPINVSGGTIKGTGEKNAYGYNGSGATDTGDALVIDNCNYPGGAPQPAITGGTFISVYADAVASYAYGEGINPIGKFISGGTFSSKPAQALIKDGYEAVKNTDGMFTVQKETAKAGDILTLNLDGTERDYLILSIDGNNAKLLGLFNIFTDYAGYPFNTKEYCYFGGELDNALEGWFDGLNEKAKSAIIERTDLVEETYTKDNTTESVSLYSSDEFVFRIVAEDYGVQSFVAYRLSKTGETTYTRHVYAPSVAELALLSKDYATTDKIFTKDILKIEERWDFYLRSIDNGPYIAVNYIEDTPAAEIQVATSWDDNCIGARPCFDIDLSKLESN